MDKKKTPRLREKAETTYTVGKPITPPKRSSFSEPIEKFLRIARATKGFPNVGFIIFHGSAAEGRALPDSDIDLCIYYSGTPKEQTDYRMSLLSRLPDEYDVQIFQQLPLYIRKEVLHGKPIYVKDERIYDVAYETIKEYEDYRPYLMRYVREERAGRIRADLILTKLSGSEDAVKYVEENLPKDCTSFVSNRMIKGSLYKEIEYAIENIIDACAILNADLSLGTPADTDDIIKKLEKAGIITKETAEKIREMKAFRNVLVHKYGEIDDKRAYEELKEGKADIKGIVKAIRTKILAINREE